MDRGTFDATIRELCRREPYRPFTVELVNGDCVRVDTPTAVAVRHGTAGYIRAGGLPVIFDHEGVNRIVGDAE